MAITNSNSSVTSFYKCRAPFVEGPPAMGWEEYSGYPISALEQRYRIICAYLQVIEDIKEPIGVDDELPFPKEQIAQAILRELEDDPDCDSRRRLEIAYVLLETFIPIDEYRIIEDFKCASICAQQVAKIGDPTSILRSARIVRMGKGDRAVRLQEKIYEKMMERRLQIQELEKSMAF